MKRNYVYFLFTYLLTFVVSGCDTDIEPEVIQAANTYNIIRTCVNIRKQIMLFVSAGMPVILQKHLLRRGFISLVCRIVWTLSVCGQVFLPTIRLM
mgnify:CR=1 FL=1